MITIISILAGLLVLSIAVLFFVIFVLKGQNKKVKESPRFYFIGKSALNSLANFFGRYNEELSKWI